MKTCVDNKKLYLVEYYTLEPGTKRGGWEIKFAWASAEDRKDAKEKMKKIKDFDEIITIEEQSERFPLKMEGGKDSSIYIN